MMAGRRLLVGLCFALACAATLAADTDWDQEIEVSTGFDSNPLKLSANEDGGGFTEATYDAELEIDVSRRSTFHVDLDATARRHGSRLSNADWTRAAIAAGLELTPYRRGKHRRVSVDAGARLALRRATFTSRQTGEVFEVDDGTGTFVPIPDRFDYDRAEGFLDVDWRLNRRVRLFVDTTYADKDYVEDYVPIATVESLDYSSLSVEPGIELEATTSLEIEVSARRAGREYDERMAVDGTGASVPDTTREYVYTGFEMKVRVRPERRWHWTFGLDLLDREDAHAGYYDYSSRTASVATRARIGARGRLRFLASRTVKKYDRSTVDSLVDGELRSSETTRFAAAYRHELTRRFDLTGEVGLRSVDNANPLYAYDRNSIGIWVGYH